MKESKSASRQERLEIVNEIMKEIASRGRKFFYHEGMVAQLVDNGKIYYKAEYGKKKLICLSVPAYRKPNGWFHGGTLFSLVKEFRDYVRTGEKGNYYSGLLSPHWGYPDDEMLAVREKAKQLGYL